MKVKKIKEYNTAPDFRNADISFEKILTKEKDTQLILKFVFAQQNLIFWESYTKIK